MASRRKTRSIALRGARLCLGACNLVLAAIAVLIGGIAVFAILGRQVPAPDFLLATVQKQLNEEGLRARWRSVHFDATGKLWIDRPELLVLSSGETALAADSAFVDIGLVSSLFDGALNLDSLRVTGGEIFLPSALDPSGTNRARVRHLNASLSVDQDRIRFHYLVLGTDNLNASVRGSLTPGALPRPSRPVSAGDTAAERPPTLAERYYELARLIDNVERRSAIAEDAALTLICEPEGTWRNRIQVEMSARSLRFGPNLRLERVYGSFPAVDLSTGQMGEGSVISAQRARFRDLANMEAVTLRMTGTLQDFRMFRVPRNLELRCARIESAGNEARAFRAEIDLAHLPHQLKLQAATHLEGGWLSADLELDAGTLAGCGSIAFDLHPMRVLRACTFIPEITFNIFHELDTARGTGHVCFDSGLHFREAHLAAQGDNLVLRGTKFEWSRARIYVNLDHAIAHDVLTVGRNGEFARGAYIQEWKPFNFRILVDGALDPDNLGPLLGKWWRTTWEPIRLEEGVPGLVDVDVVGRWLELERTQTLARADLRHVSVGEDAKFERARLRVRHGPGFVTIHDLRVEDETGVLEGAMQLRLPLPDSPPPDPRVKLEVASSLRYENFAGLAAAGHTDLSALQVFGNPQIDVSLTAGSALSAIGSIRTDSALKVFDRVRADSLRTQFAYDNGRLTLDPLSLGLFGGDTNGRIEIDDLRSLQESAVRFELEGAGINIWEAASLLKPGDEAQSDPRAPSHLALQVSGQGTGQHLDSYRAAGQFKIEGPELSRIQMLGELGRVLRTIGINLMSFEIDTLTGSFTLADGSFVLPDVQIRGPAIRIDADGTIGIDKSVQMDVKVFPLETESASLISGLSLLLRPFGHALELRLTGSVLDPQWKLRYNPLNFLIAPPEPSVPPPDPEAIIGASTAPAEGSATPLVEPQEQAPAPASNPTGTETDDDAERAADASSPEPAVP